VYGSGSVIASVDIIVFSLQCRMLCIVSVETLFTIVGE
jgi:hypothetical protein